MGTGGVERLIRPEELTRDEPLFWSPGRGVDVWQMFRAAAAGDLETLKRLVEEDPSLARCHYEYRTPLAFAVRENRVEAAAYLLELRPAYFGDPVETAHERGYTELVAVLEAKLASLAGIVPGGETIAAAIRERDLAGVRRLLDESPELLRAADRGGNQPIHWAVMTRQPDVIDELLDRGADLDAPRGDGARPIHLTWGDYGYRGWLKDFPVRPREVLDHLRARGAYVDISTACNIGDFARVRELLDEDPSRANRASDYVTYYAGSGTPLRNAAGGGHLEIVQLLLERGADPNLAEEHIAPRGHALYSAVANGHYEVARLLLERGAYPNVPVESSADTLSRALGRGDQRLVELLASYGAARSLHLLAYEGDVVTAAAVFAADPALADDPEALANAAGEGRESFVRLMLRYAPDLPRRTRALPATRELAELLFEHGMDPSHPDWLRITPLHRLAETGDVEKAAVFVEHGADLNALDEELRSTPLGWAARAGKTRMVEFLLRRGADAQLPEDPAWASPLAWATRRGHDDIVRLLRDLEAAGALPPEPGPERYESLAADLVAAYEDVDPAAARRVVQHFQIDPLTWKTGNDEVGAVRRRVRERLGRGKAADGEDRLDPADARLLIARWSGRARWAELVSALLLAVWLGACAGALAPPAGAADPPAQAPPAAAGRTPPAPRRTPYTAADVSFMSGMVPHHAQAIVMAGWAATHGARRDVRILAERIVVAQRDEIELARSWLGDRGQPVPAADATHHRMTRNGAAHDMLMPGMLTADELARLERARGEEFDRLFLESMIRHHEGALTMVDQLFGSPGAAQDDTVFKFASDVFADQTAEIDRMRQMLEPKEPSK